MHALLIEDDAEVARILRCGLAEAGVTSDHAAEGPAGLRQAREGGHDVLIVDRMLPGLDGLDLITTLRSEGVTTPALVLSALSQVDERIRGLRAGADDYVVKPYVLAELLARLEAVVRWREQMPPSAVLRVGELELDLANRAVRRADKAVSLHPREFRLLEYLMRHAGRVVTRTMLWEAAWDYHFHPGTNALDVHMSRLRQKVDAGFHGSLIHTVRGAGYYLRAE